MELTIRGLGIFAAALAIPLIIWRKRVGRALGRVMELPYTGVVVSVAVLTLALIAWADLVLLGMLYMFMPIILIAAVIVGAVARSKAYWAALLTVAAVCLLVIPLSRMIENLPAWETARFRVVLQVDTPDGLKEARGEYAILSNRVHVGNFKGGGYRLKGEDLVLDLGGGNRLRADMPRKPDHYRHYLHEVFGYSAYRDGKTSGRKELVGLNSPALVASTPEQTRSIPRGKVESFFGPGYRFRRMWLEVID